jgi:hypothetical protein
MEELRRIMFSNEELLCAFRSFARKTPTPPLSEDILSCSPVEDPSSGSIIKIEVKASPDNPNASEVVYASAEVLPRLVLFCLANNIMLPRFGKKTFEVFNSRASLVVRLNLEFDLSFEEAPMRSEDIEAIKC